MSQLLNRIKFDILTPPTFHSSLIIFLLLDLNIFKSSRLLQPRRTHAKTVFRAKLFTCMIYNEIDKYRPVNLLSNEKQQTLNFCLGLGYVLMPTGFILYSLFMFEHFIGHS